VPPVVDADEDLTEFESAPYMHMASKYYQRSTVWFMLIAAFCSFRAAGAFTVSIAYINVFFRVIQLVGVIFKKRMVAKAGYGLCTITIIMLFFACMID
jgi:hypothetical protein